MGWPRSSAALREAGLNKFARGRIGADKDQLLATTEEPEACVLSWSLTFWICAVCAGHIALQLPQQQQNDDDEEDEAAAAIVAGPAPAKAVAAAEEDDEDDDQEHDAKRAQARQARQSIGF